MREKGLDDYQNTRGTARVDLINVSNDYYKCYEKCANRLTPFDSVVASFFATVIVELRASVQTSLVAIHSTRPHLFTFAIKDYHSTSSTSQKKRRKK